MTRGWRKRRKVGEFPDVDRTGVSLGLLGRTEKEAKLLCSGRNQQGLCQV